MKFHSKSHTLFGQLQTDPAVAPTFVAADALAVFDLSVSPSHSTSEYQYDGKDSREVETVIEDSTYSLSFNTFLQAAGTVGDVPKIVTVNEACGAGSVVVAVTPTESTNSVASDDYIGFQFRRHPTATGNDKMSQILGCQGTVDISIEVGKRPMRSYSFQGNYAVASMTAALTPDFSTQKTHLAPTLTKDNLTHFKLTPEGETVAATNACISSINVTNEFGYELSRYRLSCEEGFNRMASAGDVKVVILEDEVAADYNPEDWLGTHHAIDLSYGSVAGFKYELQLSKAQLVDIQPTDVGPFKGQELTFKNIGTTTEVYG